MVALFAEAIRDLLLPCSLTLIVPAVAAALSTRRDPVAVVAAGFVGSTMIAWLRASGQIPARPVGGWVWLLGLAVLVGFAAMRWSDTGRGQRITAGAVIGGAAAAIWTPCVGQELGTVLTEAPVDPISALVPFAIFVFGLTTTALVVALGREALSIPPRVANALSVASTFVGFAIALAIATGWYTNVLAWLVLWSL